MLPRFDRNARAAGLAMLSAFLHACATPGALSSRGDSAAAVADEIPDAALASYERAITAMEAGDRVEAELELEHLVLEYPGYAGPYVNLAILYQEDARADEAEIVLDRALTLRPENAVASNQLGIVLRSQGRFAEAEAAYEAAIAADAEYAIAYMNLGILLDIYLRRPEEALANYERYQELLAEPDRAVAGWIVDLRRRLGIPAEPQRVAQEISP
ncbi:MAG TPA: tetratricopeptide repeat protein [Gammaproteobacteria bacterium]